jgi:hypothetical protein
VNGLLRYPRRFVWADAARSAAGLILSLPPLIAIDMARPVAFAFAVIAALFAAFGLRTLCRAARAYRLSAEGIAAEGCGRARIVWSALTALRLRRFQPRRGGAGWIELRLAAGPVRMKIDSELEGFDDIARAALAAARARALPLDPRSEDALVTLGLTEGLRAAPGRWDWGTIGRNRPS